MPGRSFDTLYVNDPKLTVAMGYNPKVSDVSSVNKFGHNLTATSGEDVWGGGGVYAFYPTTAQTVQAVSTSTADAPAGTGALTVEVYGLDANWEEQNETVTMNGTTPVVLVNTYIRLYRIIALTAGSSETNVGTITVGVSGGDVGAHMEAGDGQTQQTIYTIPAGKTGFFIKGYVGLADDDRNGEAADFQWLTRTNNGVTGCWAVKGEMGLVSIGSSNWQYEYGAYAGPLPEKTDIRIRTITTTTSLGVVGGYDLYLVADAT